MTTALVHIPSTVYVRSAWVDRFGHKHPSTKVHREGYTKKVKRSRGKKRRTPKSKRWYSPKVKMGWKKSQSNTARREAAIEAHKGNLLSAARSLQALSNVTTDRETKLLAAKDAKELFALHAESK